MKLRIVGFLIAAVLGACAAPSQEPRAAKQAITVVAQTPASSSQDQLLRPSFQKCVDAAAGATWPTQDCISAEYDYQDGRLNRAYRQLLGSLPPQVREALRLRQRSWISTRDAQCPWDEDREGQGRRLEASYCAMERTATRAAELEVELSKLSKVSP